MRYPIGIQSFSEIRENGFVYVDKSALIYRLAKEGKYYFLSRPRRFGKSLLVSTLEAYFKGRKELFSGLAIESLEKDWKEYPVLHLDLNSSRYMTPEELDVVLGQHLDTWEERYGITPKYNNLSARFSEVIDSACARTGCKAVVLIDEYDKPIVNNLGEDSLADYYKKTLQGFYSVLKAKDSKIHFAFLTGVSKIGKLSVFSGLNNLRDISMDSSYAGICGISEEELHTCFDTSVKELAQANEMTVEECYGKLRSMYDGYCFDNRMSVGVYNPFSLLNTFASKDFRDYWFETGTPTLLVNVMKKTSFDVTTLSDNIVVGSEELTGMMDIVNHPVPLFFQTGYLTIKHYDAEFQEYRLGFPNEEVKRGFLRFIYSFYVPSKPSEGATTANRLARALRAGKADEFMQIMESIFADTTYQIQVDAEKDFQYAMYIIMELVGEYVQAERSTSNGRIDILVQTGDYIYIIELKVDGSAEDALAQIEEKGYAKPFAADRRKIFKIGVNFSTASRRIDGWKVVG